ncbi:RING finger and WD repeat domain-containing protein 2 [Geranomyces variabilis]|uniref:RING finger and WD repeat domain-containing protein 2 n=1 Tax=Geranomyces variabilis TaxID=109894 RepID=A0AAD5XN75_9FUNG|nr:RING finger and WD repeat domain-containing protein 2 [Geranomyces variabilis]
MTANAESPFPSIKTEDVESLQKSDDQHTGQQLVQNMRTEVSLHLLHEFLLSTQRAKQAALSELTEQLAVLQEDISKISTFVASAREFLQPRASPAAVPLAVPTEYEGLGKKRSLDEMENSQHNVTASNPFDPTTRPTKKTKLLSASSLVRKQCERIELHAEELQSTYFAVRPKVTAVDLNVEDRCLSLFADDLADLSRYTRLRTVANLDYAHGLYNTGSCIVSSIDFNKDDHVFATAGVTKKIKIFDYRNVLSDMREEILGPTRLATNGGSGTRDLDDDAVPTAEHLARDDESADEEQDEEIVGDQVPRFPIMEIGCNSKISSLAWNPCVYSRLASADYEGLVHLWDSETGSAIRNFDEHEKRVWSVDWTTNDPDLFASSSDDAKGKLWSVNQRSAVATVQSTVNLCTVKWNPEVHNQIAFGSADHHIHYYDTRNLATPLHVFQGHSKAVSYVNFVSANTLLSCSTDSTLRSWDVSGSISTGQSKCTQKYAGHVNVKNFVGMSVDCSGEYIACGSETDEVHVYWKWLGQSVVKREMGGARDPITARIIPRRKQEPPTVGGPFLSSICWQRTQPGRLIAANSHGRVSVMELV